MEATTASTDLERELGELLEQERFEPPGDFAAAALVTDESLHERAARRPGRLVGGAGRRARLVRAEPTRSSTTRTRRSTSGSPTAS